MALGVPVRLRLRIFSTFGTTRVVGCQPNAKAAFTPGEIPGTHFQRLSRPQGKWFCWKKPREKSQVTPPGIDPGTVRLIAQRLNNYATPGLLASLYQTKMRHIPDDSIFKIIAVRNLDPTRTNFRVMRIIGRS